MDIEQQFKEMLEDTADALKVEIQLGTGELAEYAAERALYLSDLVGQEGFSQAVLAERDAVALRAGLVASRALSVGQQRFLGVLQGSIRFAALMLAGTQDATA